MNNPERAAAILALHLVKTRRSAPIKELFQIWPRFQIWPSRAHVEQLAEAVLDKGDLPIEPYLRYVVGMIVDYLENLPRNSPLPTERELMAWIAGQGGIPALLLKYTASQIGPA